MRWRQRSTGPGHFHPSHRWSLQALGHSTAQRSAMPGLLSTEGDQGSALFDLEVLPSAPCLDLGTSGFSLLQHSPKMEMGKLGSQVLFSAPPFQRLSKLCPLLWREWDGKSVFQTTERQESSASLRKIMK